MVIYIYANIGGIYMLPHIYSIHGSYGIYIYTKTRTETLYQVTSYCKAKFHPLAVDSDIAQLAPPE